MANGPLNRIDPQGLIFGCTCNTERIEDVETIVKLIEAVGKNKDISSKDLLALIPNPSTALIRLLNAMCQSAACKEMLRAKTCEEFKNQYVECDQELLLKYQVLTKGDRDGLGALTEDLFNRIAAVKEKKVCCKK